MINNFENLTAFIENLNTVVDKMVNQPDSITKEDKEFGDTWQLEMAKAIILDTDKKDFLKVANIILAFYSFEESQLDGYKMSEEVESEMAEEVKAEEE